MARSLAKAHPDIGYHALYSAASYLLRDGRDPRARMVVDEGRRRVAAVEQAIANRRKLVNRVAA